MWTSSQPVLKDISPGCSLEGLMLKLKLQYFGQLMRRADSLEKTLYLVVIDILKILGKIALPGPANSERQKSDPGKSSPFICKLTNLLL